MRRAPRRLSYRKDGAEQVRELVRTGLCGGRARVSRDQPHRPPPRPVRDRRGPRRSTSEERRTRLRGRFIDLFAPQLPIVSSVKLTPGRRACSTMLIARESRSRASWPPRARRWMQTTTSGRHAFGSAPQGPEETEAVLRIGLPEQLRDRSSLDGQPLCRRSWAWDDAAHLMLLRFPNKAAGRQIEVRSSHDDDIRKIENMKIVDSGRFSCARRVYSAILSDAARHPVWHYRLNFWFSHWIMSLHAVAICLTHVEPWPPIVHSRRRGPSPMKRAWSCLLAWLLLVPWPRPDEAMDRGLDGPAARRQLPRLDGPADRGRIDRLHGPADRPGTAPDEGPLRRPEQGQRVPGHGRRRDQGNRGRARLRAQGSAAWSGRPTASGCSPAPSKGTSRLFRLDGYQAAARPPRSRITPEGQVGQPGARGNGDHPRRLAAVRGRRQSQRRRRGRPRHARCRCGSTRSRTCPSSPGSRTTKRP